MKCHLDEFHSKEKIQINSSKRRFVPKTLHKNQEQGIKVKIILIYLPASGCYKKFLRNSKVYKRRDFFEIPSLFFQEICVQKELKNV